MPNCSADFGEAMAAYCQAPATVNRCRSRGEPLSSARWQIARRGFGDAAAGDRFLLRWSGAEYRGCFRQTNWDGELRIEDNEIVSIRPVNFFNPDKQPKLVDPRSVTWASITTGNFAAVELVLGHANQGRYHVTTPHGVLEGAFADVKVEPHVLDCGKLDRAVSIERLPPAGTERRGISLRRKVALRKESDNPLYVALTLEDGHQAWSSPIYLIRR